MPALLWVLAAVGMGVMLALRFGGLRALAPRWAAALLIFGSGTAAGIGITSTIFFLCRLLLPGVRPLPMILEAALAAWLGVAVYREPRPPAAVAPAKSFAWKGVLGAVLLVIVGIDTLAMTSYWEANPQGDWDAWAIWNLRARFLASGGGLAYRAWSPVLSNTHPEYPLLVSGFVARCWSYSGSTDTAAPVATGYAFYLALLAMGVGGLAVLESGSLGLLLGIAIAGTPLLVHEVPSQYSDIPLSCYFAGAILLMLLDRPLGAGLMAGMAAWTKDEGLLFLAVFLAMLAILRRRQILPAIAGAIPAGLVALVFKLVLARSSQSLLTQSVRNAGIWSKLADSSRYLTVAGAAIQQFWNMRIGWYHPALPLIALAATLKLKPNWRRDAPPAAALTAAMAAGYLLIYVVTPNDLNWQLQTSLGRLAVQLWPALLITIFSGLRAPEQTAFTPRADLPAGAGRRKSEPRTSSPLAATLSRNAPRRSRR